MKKAPEEIRLRRNRRTAKLKRERKKFEEKSQQILGEMMLKFVDRWKI